MQNNILFDNIYIGHSVEDARKLADETFFLKHPIEQALEQADKPKEEEPATPKSPSDLKFLDDPVHYIKEKVELFVTLWAKDPREAISFVPEVPAAIVSIIVALGAVAFAVLGAGSSAAPVAKKVASDLKDKVKDAKDKVAEATTTGADAGKDGAAKRTTRSHN